MRKRIVTVALMLLGVLVALILFRSLFNDEPTYRGKRLSVWFKQYYRSGQWSRQRNEPNEPQHEQSARALRAMGTNAIPFLVAECFTTKEESSVQTNVLTFLATLPWPFRFPPFVPAKLVRWEAAYAIGEIKPPASLLLPLVTNQLNSPDKFQRWMATYLLGRIGEGGEAAVPFLREKLLSADVQELNPAALSLDLLGPASVSAVPDLVEYIRTNNSYSIYYACRALARIGPPASNAIPVLNERLAVETNALKQVSIAVALICIDGRQTGAMAVLQADLAGGHHANTRPHAVYALKDIGTNVRPAMPLLLTMLDDPDPSVWHSALSVILSLGETNLAISRALEKLKAGDLATRHNVLRFLIRVQPANSFVMTNLVIEADELSMGAWAIEEAARLGTLAQPVLPRLREIAANKTNPYRDVARKALEMIESDMAEERAAR